MGTDIALFFGLGRPIRTASDFRFLGRIRARVHKFVKTMSWVGYLTRLIAEGGVDAMTSGLAMELVDAYDIPRPLSRDTAVRMIWMTPKDRREPAALAEFLGHMLSSSELVSEALRRAIVDRGVDRFGTEVVTRLIGGGVGGEPITPSQLEAEVRRQFEARYGSGMEALRVIVRENRDLDPGTAQIISALVA